MSFDPPHDFSKLSGETLRNEARRTDRLLGRELERLRQTDEQFRAVLDRSLALEVEIDRRKNR